MSFFTEEKVDTKSPYTDLGFGDADNGTIWYFFYDNKKKATSKDYGDFEIIQGVNFDGTKKSQDEILATVKLAGFIPNTLIKNMMSNGGLIRGEAYKIVKKWSKDDKYDPKNPKLKAKGHGYEFFRLKAPDSFLEALKKKHDELFPGIISESGSEEAGISTADIDV
jgi:hypothetical protein